MLELFCHLHESRVSLTGERMQEVRKATNKNKPKKKPQQAVSGMGSYMWRVLCTQLG